jgi:aminoglycoside/choline kinase family phosphotransferase/UTP-glucose-1-phosphate uridylyltransferase
MKALILSAGLGTRLRPYTRVTPKPLFSINEKPVLGLAIERLRQAGCHSVIVNTHHGRERIDAFVQAHDFGIPVRTRFESELLGTGGAIRNVADFWADGPLLVVNADIVTTIDLAAVYRFHRAHAWPVTMVMHDYPIFDTVAVDDQGFVTGFAAADTLPNGSRRMAFTGIHVLDRSVLDFIPATGPSHIIDAYGQMIHAGCKLKAYSVEGHYWRDIGTPDSYRRAVMDQMAPLAFEKAFQITPSARVAQTDLAGDGSDRRWVRLSCGAYHLVVADHGIRQPVETCQEVDAFVAIGQHLHARQIAVPRIHLFDRFAGLVFMEDLGDRHLQQQVRRLGPSQIEVEYRRVIDNWFQMAVAGYRGFNPAWAWQSRRYDRDLILDKECRYFMEAWVRGWLGWDDVHADELTPEFERLADAALESATMGFMHRDLQSRNIMIKDGTPYFIDFQGGRIGPMQYDLASLLIDPYVALAPETQERLCAYAAQKAARELRLRSGDFLRGYAFCALTRNLQMLGAFGFLSKVKGKVQFESYIPRALRTLRHQLEQLTCEQGRPAFPELTELVQAAARHVGV